MNLEHLSKGITSETCAAEVMETIPLIMRFIRSQMRSQGEPNLSVPQFRTMMFLYRHPGASLSNVAEHLGVTRPTASVICDRLVQRSLIDRAEDPKQRRSVVLKLTETGCDRLQEMRQITRTKIADILAELSEEQLLHTFEVLEILNSIFKDAE
ncbi:MarR family transcriptional regulator [Oscillatoriales cyanobacterium USR001]|nr:MarR family transcriptional regulator [Oscillatoriales cyanobacterium USR001]